MFSKVTKKLNPFAKKKDKGKPKVSLGDTISALVKETTESDAFKEVELGMAAVVQSQSQSQVDQEQHEPYSESAIEQALEKLGNQTVARLKAENQNQRRDATSTRIRKEGSEVGRRSPPPFQILPTRPMKDLLMDFSRYGFPTDSISWSNRVKGNLLYYQSNYAALAIIVVTFFATLRPLQFLVGSFLVCGAVLFSRGWIIKDIPSPNKIVVGGMTSIWICLPFTFYSSILFCLSILISLALIFIHASLRLRDFESTISNTGNRGAQKTPMGLILEYYGI